jgi:putative heme-binding domain-containing protein
MRWSVATLVGGLSVLLLISAAPAARDPAELVVPSGPRTPADEAKGFQLPQGFEAQLVACEPDIHKPINIAFDERGRLWVTNTIEYPFPAPEGKTPRDRLTILDDLGPDGRARKITQFAEGLNIPVGVLPTGGNSAIVFSIPNIYSVVDTKGTGHADQRKLLLGSIGRDDTHGMTGSFVEGFDGWIYAVHGFRNTSTVKGTDGSEITMNSGNTYRFHRDGSHIQFFTHGQVNPFGLAFDPLGNLYSSDCETKPIYLLMRGGFYPSFGKPDDGLGFAPQMCDHLYGSTAIAGLIDYVAPEYPAEFHNMMLVGNVVTATINRCQLSERGSWFHADDAPDFLVSEDKWFRPTNIKLGPDGALYVADFYNKIIGHYEVDLNHPGRDRERGRIWRIVYKGNTAQAPAPKAFDLTKDSVPQLIAKLSDPNFTVRMMSMNYLADQVGQAVVAPLKEALVNKPSTELKVHGFWILKRLGALDDSMLVAAAKDSDRSVRVHAMRMLAETEKWNAEQRELALAGLKDEDPIVQRCAADALGQHPQFENIRPLLDAREHAPQSDTHLVYVLRMALRNQLEAQGVADKLPPAGATPQDIRNLDDVALGAKSAGSAALILKHLADANESGSVLVHYLQHIGSFGTDAQADGAAKIVSSRFNSDDSQQATLLKALLDGLAQRNGKLGPAASGWARTVATRLLNSNEEDFAGWTNRPVAAFPDAPNPWSVQMRASADGDNASPFISSLPLGEKGTGVLRSKAFVIPAHLTFFIAGHSGVPGRVLTRKNLITLHSSDDNKMLMEARAPRNDAAQKVEWDLSQFAGRRGYLVARDSDDGTAYAWIAFGRFDPPVVKVPMLGERLLAIDIAGQQHLTELGGKIAEILADRKADVNTRIAAAGALGSIDASSHSAALITALSDASAPPALREAVGNALSKVTTPQVSTAFIEAMRTAPRNVQLSLAKSLASTPDGADALLNGVSQGKASAQLLMDSTLRERLKVSSPADLDARINKLTANMPPADKLLQNLIDGRVAYFNAHRSAASAERGAKVFATNCQICHRIANQGAQIGPQLDGIGVRGAPRLAEDILDPSRNVDAAFRYSTFQLDDGNVIAGIPRREEGQTLVIADSTGKEIAIPKTKIRRRVESNLSLMPSNFGEIIKETDFDDLLSYLLNAK